MNSIFYFLVPVASSWSEIHLFDEVKHKVNNTIHQLLDRMEQELQQGQNGFIYKVIQVGGRQKIYLKKILPCGISISCYFEPLGCLL